MTEQDARNPEAVGFLTAAFHYAAANRAARDGKPEPVPADVEKFLRYVMHVDPRVNALWYRLLDEIFTYEKRQAEIQEKIEKEMRECRPMVFELGSLAIVPLIPREDWKGTAVEQAQERMLEGMGIPPHLSNPDRGTPHYGPSAVTGCLRAWHFLEVLKGRRHAPYNPIKTATISEFEKQCMDPKLGEPHEPPAMTIPFEKIPESHVLPDAYALVGTPHDVPNPLKKLWDVAATGAYELEATEFTPGTLRIEKDGRTYYVPPPEDDDPQPITVNATPQ